MQNGYIESLNGKFRHKCLNEYWIQTLPQARPVVAAWRKDFNEVRPAAVLVAFAHHALRSSIASKLSMLRKPNYPTARSINLSTPDFLPLAGTEKRGQVTVAASERPQLTWLAARTCTHGTEGTRS
jgi:hypothetical protein